MLEQEGLGHSQPPATDKAMAVRVKASKACKGAGEDPWPSDVLYLSAFLSHQPFKKRKYSNNTTCHNANVGTSKSASTAPGLVLGCRPSCKVDMPPAHEKIEKAKDTPDANTPKTGRIPEECHNQSTWTIQWMSNEDLKVVWGSPCDTHWMVKFGIPYAHSAIPQLPPLYLRSIGICISSYLKEHAQHVDLVPPTLS